MPDRAAHTAAARATAQGAARVLIWCLIALLPWLGLGLVQRQTLGPLHVHGPAPAAASGPAVSTLLHEALDWWWGQVLAQSRARAHHRAHADGQVHGHAQVDAHTHPPTHTHTAWQRHHHGLQDPSVMALDAAAEALDAQSAAAALLLVLGAPVGGWRLAAGLARYLAWPQARGVRVRSWGIAPPLPPPRG